MIIEYGDDFLPVEYNLLDFDIVQRWAERLIAAQSFPYFIDHPNRFYGFDKIEDQIKFALNEINTLCYEIEKLGIAVQRRLDSIDDQDTLNYLHSIFETYHGLLDNKLSNGILEKNLSDLNIAVHRCESIQRGARPRHVVTYFGLPKTKILELQDYQHFTNNYIFGTVYLNYAEIGKTIEDLTLDNDHYISEAAFQPFRHYTADFNVKFYNSNFAELKNLEIKMKEYYYNNENFFKDKGLDIDSPYLKPGSVPLATLFTKIGLDDIKTRQNVRSVKLYE